MDMTVTRETIRAMAAADAEEAANLLRRGDFGERLDFFQWALTQPAIGPVVAEHGAGSSARVSPRPTGGPGGSGSSSSRPSDVAAASVAGSRGQSSTTSSGGAVAPRS